VTAAGLRRGPAKGGGCASRGRSRLSELVRALKTGQLGDRLIWHAVLREVRQEATACVAERLTALASLGSCLQIRLALPSCRGFSCALTLFVVCGWRRIRLQAHPRSFGADRNPGTLGIAKFHV
jgi:hypothetical protein